MKIVKELDGTEWALKQINEGLKDYPHLSVDFDKVYWTWGLGDDGLLYQKGVLLWGDVPNWSQASVSLTELGFQELSRICHAFENLMPFL